MRALVEARATLEACHRRVLSPLSALEQKLRGVQGRVEQLGQLAEKEALAASGRASARSASLDSALARARARVRTRTASEQVALERTLDALELPARSIGAELSAAEQQLAELASGLAEPVATIGAGLSSALESLESGRRELQNIAQPGLTLLRDANARLVAVQKQLEQQLGTAETTFSTGIEALKSTANTFVEGIRTATNALRAGVSAATSPAIAGADALGKLVSDLVSSANTLIEQVESVVGLAVGAIDKVPVAALPEPMAAPAINALTQLSTQFATQLQNGAKAASSQLSTLASQVSSAIEQGQTRLSDELSRALQPMLTQIDQLATQIEQERKRLDDQVGAKIDALKQSLDGLLDTAGQQIDAIVKPTLAQVTSCCNALEQAAARLEQSATQIADAASERLATLENQLTAARARLPMARKPLDDAWARVLRQIGDVGAPQRS